MQSHGRWGRSNDEQQLSAADAYVLVMTAVVAAPRPMAAVADKAVEVHGADDVVQPNGP
jgi:hypothetical protein